MKREFLVENYKDISKYLQKNSLTCKLYKYADKNSYMYEFENCTYVLEDYKKFKKLVLICEKEITLDKTIISLQEITNDERYSKEYLKLFGNPKKYEFDLEKVLKKCDSVGTNKMSLTFPLGVSTTKVFKVVLYRLNQLYNNDKTKIKKLKKAYKLAKKVFDEEVVNKLLNNIENQEVYDLNFKAFINEESFFDTEVSQKPIYFYEKKEKLFDLV